MIEKSPNPDVKTSFELNTKIHNQNLLTRVEKNSLVAFSSIATALSSLPILASQSAIVIIPIVLLPFFAKIMGTFFLPVCIAFVVPLGITILTFLIIMPINIIIFYVAHHIFCKIFKNPKTGQKKLNTEVKKTNDTQTKEIKTKTKNLSEKVEKIEIENLKAKERKKLLLIVAASAAIGAFACATVITIAAIVSLFVFTINPITSFPFLFLGCWLLLSCSIGVITNIIAFNVISKISTSIQKKQISQT
jgi:hypothetical protein